MNSFYNILKKMNRKSFYIELSSLSYPLNTEVVDSVVKYAQNNNFKLIINKPTMPIEFTLNKELYAAKIQMARGSYYILCTKIN